MTRKINIQILFSVSIAFFAIQANAQFSGGADLVSRYLWRGQLLASSPSIQPYISFSKEGKSIGFEIGAWGSYALSADDGTEADLYATISHQNFSLTLTDYFFPSDTKFAQSDDYFDYDNHVLEAGLSYEGPVSANLYYNLTGDVDESGENLNSIYGTLSYEFNEAFEMVIGVGNGWYSSDTKFDLVNISAIYSKDLKLSETFALPVSTTLAINPSIEKIFIVFGLSF